MTCLFPEENPGLQQSSETVLPDIENELNFVFWNFANRFNAQATTLKTKVNVKKHNKWSTVHRSVWIFSYSIGRMLVGRFCLLRLNSKIYPKGLVWCENFSIIVLMHSCYIEKSSQHMPYINWPFYYTADVRPLY